MCVLEIFALNAETGELRQKKIEAEVFPIALQPIKTPQDVRNHVPRALDPLLRAAFGAKADVAVLTCRRKGVPEQRDGSHNAHYLVDGQKPVKLTMMTY